MDSEIKKFFELFIGYDGSNWNVEHAQKYQDGVHSYFLHDMENMIKDMVGYPSILYLMNTIAFLGYCMKYEESWKVPDDGKAKNNEFYDAGGNDDFVYFCKEYLSKSNEKYEKLAEELFDFIRNRLSHIYLTHNAITTNSSAEHLEIKDKGSEYPYIFISVKIFFDDTKKSIEDIYKKLETNETIANQFKEKQKFILDWAWKLQRNLNSINLNDKNKQGPPPNYDYPNGSVSGVPPYTATGPQFPS